MMIIDKPYYEDNTRISNSAIGWFLKKGPRFLKDILDGKGEELKLPQLERGTMIHKYLLQPDEFWKDYTILDFIVPKSKQQKEVLSIYALSKLTEPLEDEDKLKLKAYKQIYKNKLSDTSILVTMNELIEEYSDYLEYVKTKQNKKVISGADLNMLKIIKDNISKHKKANELLTDKSGVDSYNEFHINWEYTKADISCKSLLDRVIFDHINKKVTLIDLKTTSDVYNFKHSVEEFDYYRQIAYYLLAITWYLIDLGLDVNDYDFEAYIIAIQTNGNYEVRVFDMFNEDEILDRKNLIANALTEISYHYQTGNWDHTRAYYESDGCERLQ